MNQKIITGCDDCPCCDMLDMSAGYRCTLVDSNVFGYIPEKKNFNGAITPVWCPLKVGPLTLRFAEMLAPVSKRKPV